jgi:hypothetical protein
MNDIHLELNNTPEPFYKKRVKMLKSIGLSILLFIPIFVALITIGLFITIILAFTISPKLAMGNVAIILIAFVSMLLSYTIARRILKK